MITRWKKDRWMWKPRARMYCPQCGQRCSTESSTNGIPDCLNKDCRESK